MLRQVTFPLSKCEKLFFESVSVKCNPSVVVRKHAPSGYGLWAKSDIPAGSILVSVPPQTWLPYSGDFSMRNALEGNSNFVNSIKNILRPFSFGSGQTEKMEKSICLSIQLSLHRQQEDPYVSFLYHAREQIPLCASLPHPLCMPNDAFLRYLDGTDAAAHLKHRRQLYNSLAESLFPGQQQQQDVFLWGIGTLLSRAVSGSQTPFTLVPVLDLLNHHSSPNAEHKYDEKSGWFHVTSNKDIRNDEEICITYGNSRDNSSFLSLYGFCPQTVGTKSKTVSACVNMNNSIKLQLGADGADEVQITMQQVNEVQLQLDKCMTTNGNVYDKQQCLNFIKSFCSEYGTVIEHLGQGYNGILVFLSSLSPPTQSSPSTPGVTQDVSVITVAAISDVLRGIDKKRCLLGSRTVPPLENALDELTWHHWKQSCDKCITDDGVLLDTLHQHWTIMREFLIAEQ